MKVKSFLTILVGVLFLLTMVPLTSHAEVPQSINYQGLLTGSDENPVPDGDYEMSFAIYDALTDGTSLWSESQTVTVTNGIYNVQIGQDPVGNPFPADLFEGERYLGITVETDPEMTPRQCLTSVPFAMKAEKADYADIAANIENGTAIGDLFVDGSVGIGTPTPRTDLEIEGTEGLRVTTGQHPYVYGQFKHGYSDGLIMNAHAGGGGWADMRFQTNGTDRMFIESAGNVGIGTTAPAGKLHVVGKTYLSGWVGIGTTSPDTRVEIHGDGSSWAEGFLSIKNEDRDAGIRLYDSDTDVKHHIFNDNGYFDVLRICPQGAYGAGGIIITQGGNVGIGTGRFVPTTMLTVAGSIKLTGGSDLAEPFQFDKPDVVKPGMVVAIDPDRPGKLKPAGSPYDRCVAGIVSGAGGVRPGLLMMQEDALEGEHEVALVGRVYGFCDASYGPINPGDLLTTSPTTGHAMKVTDYDRSQGAILGKAMTRLEHGKDLVLVLVGLQ